MRSTARERRALTRANSITARLLAVFLVPVVAVAIAAALQVRSANADVASVRRQRAIAASTGGPSALVSAIMDERNRAVVDLAGFGGLDLQLASDLATAKSRTDAVLREQQRALAEAPESVRRLQGAAIAATEATLEDLRVRTTGIYQDYGVPTDPTRADGTARASSSELRKLFEGYNALVTIFQEANDELVRLVDDAQLRNLTESILAQSRSSNRVAELVLEMGILPIPEPGGELSTEPVAISTPDSRTIQSLFDQYKAANVRALALLADAPDARQVVEAFLDRASQEAFRTTVERRLDVTAINVAQVVELLEHAADEQSPNSTDALNATLTAVDARADHLIDEARTRQRNVLVVLGGSLVAAVALALLLARSLARPILLLARQAHELTERDLPEAVGLVLAGESTTTVVAEASQPISPTPISEVNEVVDALNAAYDAALELATEQASVRHGISEVTLNLGRRVQGLVGRQLAELERLGEPEVDRAAVLDRLERLTARIRRNADSMVVLAGQGGSSQLAARTPVSLNGLLARVIDEVEQGGRVTIGELIDTVVSGTAAPTLTHLVTELVENALSYSPPDESVRIDGSLRTGGYELRITDRGIGMGAEAQGVANARLAGDDVDGAPARLFGHLVVGMLARRIEARVHLEPAPGGGTVAVVALDASCLVPAEATEG